MATLPVPLRPLSPSDYLSKVKVILDEKLHDNTRHSLQPRDLEVGFIEINGERHTIMARGHWRWNSEKGTLRQGIYLKIQEKGEVRERELDQEDEEWLNTIEWFHHDLWFTKGWNDTHKAVWGEIRDYEKDLRREILEQWDFFVNYMEFA